MDSKEKLSKREIILNEKAAKISIKEGSATSLMEGFGNRYITPYALAIGASNFQIGLLSSVPGLLGNLVQIPLLKLMEKYPRKRIVFLSVLFQALLWIPIIAIGFLYFVFHLSSQVASNLLIITYSLMIISGTIGSPAWNSWMKDIIPENKRGIYFGKRNRIVNLVLVFAMLFSGIVLNYFGKDSGFRGFLIVFIVAFIGRTISALFIKKQYEPKFVYDNKTYFSIFQFIRKMFSNNFGHFVIFVSLLNFSTAIAGPFFAVYILKEINLSYLQYTIIILANVFSIILFMPFWGKISDKFGNVEIMRITGFMIFLIPVFYLFSVFIFNFSGALGAVFFLILVEVFSGFAWAGFNLCAGNFIFDAVTRQKTALCVAYYNFINAFGVFVGAGIGGFIISRWDIILGIKSLFFVFLVSAVLRYLTALVMSRRLSEVKPVKKLRFRDFLKEIKIHHFG